MVKNYVEQKFKNSSNGSFEIKKAKDWIKEAKTQPIPKKLFGNFWCENELCILFADTNVGKSILAVQIADIISKSKKDQYFTCEVANQKVLYFDFELSKKQFEKRYSKEYKDHYVFHQNFLRVEKNESVEILHSIEKELKRTILETNAKIIIIDNLGMMEHKVHNASVTIPLMGRLNDFKKLHGLSILILAHTPKRNLSKPITENDLGGSKTLINYCDAAFTIGLSGKDKNTRYLKQIKVRGGEKLYDTTNVMVCQICKPKNFLQFEFLKFCAEEDHLKTLKKVDHEDLINEVLGMFTEGKSYREIGNELGISHMTVSRYIKK